MSVKSDKYQAWMLRLWREDNGKNWRMSLENAHTGERCAFRHLNDLVCFLHQSTEAKHGENSDEQANDDLDFTRGFNF